MEASKGGHLAVEYGHPATDDAGVGFAMHLAVGNETSGSFAFVDFENLTTLRMTDHRLAGQRIQQSEHRLTNLVDQLVNNRVKLDFDPCRLRRLQGSRVSRH